MQIQKNKSIRDFNTFAIDAKADYFVEITSVAELKELINSDIYQQNEKLILGGGSNLLLTKNVPGLAVHIAIMGKEVESQLVGSAVVGVNAGENWHEFVLYTLEHNLAGLENLSFIPGSVGAAPMQNIGAYGIEIKDTLEYVEAVDATTGELRRFNKEECEFGYRESIFKRALKGKYIITRVGLRLDKFPHKLNTSYGAIEEELRKSGKDPHDWTIADVSKAVTQIRRTKLPDPAEIGTAGSFFKNPIIEKTEFERILASHPGAPSYPEGEKVKVPAGWLIEQSGWKGKRFGDAGVHKDHALVLVNYGLATGAEVWDLAMQIQADVKSKFGIILEPEVNIY